MDDKWTPTFLTIYLHIGPIFFKIGHQGETRSLTTHPELSHNIHPMDRALVGVCPILPKRRGQIWDNNQVPMEVC